MSESRPIRSERTSDLLHIYLARPDVRNALDGKMVEELTKLFQDVGDVRAVVIAGDGLSFCAGSDVAADAGAETSFDDPVAGGQSLFSMLELIRVCPAPVVCCVHGHALGAGAAIAACSDIVLAHETTAFAFSEVKLGISPSVVAPFVVPRIGLSQARRYLITGERFDAMTAFRIGLVHEVTGDLDETLARLLAELRTAAPAATRRAKLLALEQAPAATLRDADLSPTRESIQGVLAFLDGRQPEWMPPR